MNEPPKTPWQQRFGTYFFGVAIGCVMAGLMLYSRSIAYAPRPTPDGAGVPAATGVGKPSTAVPGQGERTPVPTDGTKPK